MGPFVYSFLGRVTLYVHFINNSEYVQQFTFIHPATKAFVRLLRLTFEGKSQQLPKEEHAFKVSLNVFIVNEQLFKRNTRSLRIVYAHDLAEI